MKNKLNLLSGILSFLLSAAAIAALSFAAGDVKHGETLVKQHSCDGSCHTNIMNEALSDNPLELYTRENRLVKTASQLEPQVQFCATSLKLSLFPEDIQAVSNYLNQQHYKFK